MTQKDELAQAQARNVDLEKQLKASEGLQTQLDQANTNLKTTEKARDDEKARADKAEKFAGEETARGNKAEADLKTANDKIAGLEKDKKTTTGAAAEQLARNGVTAGTETDPEAANRDNGADIAALADQFTKASMNEKREMLAGKDGARLRAYAAEQAKKAKG